MLEEIYKPTSIKMILTSLEALGKVLDGEFLILEGCAILVI